MTAAALPLPDGKVHLAVISNSAMSCFRRCPREFKYRYKMLRRPRRTSDALRFGTLFHHALNAWWRGGADRIADALLAIDTGATEETDAFEAAKAKALILGYEARWCDAGYETVEVERPFETALVNPTTGAASKTYRIAGKVDALTRRDGRLVMIEHKTTSGDITPGSNYWAKVSALDTQVSTYLSAMRELGVDSCVYDVIRKIALRPKKATPEADRKYTAKGFLYANQREEDETPDEFFARCVADIAADPSKYYARGPLVRLPNDAREHAADTWQTAWMMRESENSGRYPRHPNACERYGNLCDYFSVCSGTANIDDNHLFRTAETPHEELSEV